MNRIIPTIFLTILVSCALGQEANTSIEYEYITVTVDDREPKDVYISYSNGDYQKLKIESSGKHDYSGVLKVVNEKEKLGFELFSNSFVTFGGSISYAHNYYILRKRKD